MRDRMSKRTIPFGSSAKRSHMSVQAGIWNFDGRPVDGGVLAGFSESLEQQSPDAEYAYRDDFVTLLYRPFHTTTESRREKQPHFSRRGFILTWDGRLDNREELIAELRNELENDPTDAAIIGAAFDRWETDCFRRIVGDWAVSVWERERREVVFATDYMSVRHIFYYLKKDQVWWATDLTPLVLLSGDKFNIDDDYLAGYIAADPDANLSPYREIRQVPPGQFVCIRDGRATTQRYWRFSPRSRIRYKADAEYEEHFRQVFRQSVRRRLRSGNPVLAELSGGLDSSSIICMADDILANEGPHAPRLDTLSLYDKAEPKADDWQYIQKVEQKRGRVGAHIDASRLGISPESLDSPEFTPLPGSLGIARHIQAERAEVMSNGGYRAVLSGIGGDEFMGGNPDPSPHLADLIVQFKLIRLAKQLTDWSLVKRRPWIQLLWRASLELLPAALACRFVEQGTITPWIEKSFAKRTRMGSRQIDTGQHFGLWLPTRRSCIGSVCFMANKLAKVRCSAPLLEEPRYPYLDQNLIEFILAIPASQLLRPGERRSLMRRSLLGLVPEEILSRKTKQFCSRAPVLVVERNWEQLQAALESPIGSRLGYINQRRFLQALQAARRGREIHVVRMLRTISLEFWLRDLAERRLLADNNIGAPDCKSPDFLLWGKL